MDDNDFEFYIMNDLSSLGKIVESLFKSFKPENSITLLKDVIELVDNDHIIWCVDVNDEIRKLNLNKGFHYGIDSDSRIYFCEETGVEGVTRKLYTDNHGLSSKDVSPNYLFSNHDDAIKFVAR